MINKILFTLVILIASNMAGMEKREPKKQCPPAPKKARNMTLQELSFDAIKNEIQRQNHATGISSMQLPYTATAMQVLQNKHDKNGNDYAQRLNTSLTRVDQARNLKRRFDEVDPKK